MNLELLLEAVTYWSELFSPRFLALYVVYFLYLMYVKDKPSDTFLMTLAILLIL